MPANINDVLSGKELTVILEIIADIEARPQYIALTASSKQAVMTAVLNRLLTTRIPGG
jgi:hypothetical protein